MSSALKCPNSSCPYLFDPSRVPEGVVLTCPRCGMRFTLGQPAPVAPAVAPAPQSPNPTIASGFDGLAAPAIEPGPDGSPQRRSFSAAGESSPLQTGIIAFICFVMLAGVGVMIYFSIVHKPNPVGGETGQRLHAHNLSFEVPGSPWALDDDTRAKLGPPMILAFKRTEPDAFMAIGAKDFESREPRPSELRSAIDHLMEHNFEDITRTNIPEATFLGQPTASAFSFRATLKDSRVAGLAFATSYKGIGYWSISWAGERDAEEQSATFEAIRDKLKLEKSRENWTPKDHPVRTFGGHAVRYQVLDGEDIWKEPDAKDRPATGEDPRGDLLLAARVKQKGADFFEEATLVTVLLDPDGSDPLAQARKYVEERCSSEVKAANEKFVAKFIERSGAPEGDPPSNPVDTPAPVVRLQMTVQGASSSSKLVVISAIKVGDRVVVVHAYCAWTEKEMFEAKLMQIAGSLRESR